MFTIVLLLAVAVVALLLYAYTRPDSYRVESKITIAAPARTILPYLRNLQERVNWSQWERIDPNGKREYGGVMGEVGSTYHWDSKHKQAGEGRMEIISISDNRVEVDVQFIRPFPGRAKVDYLLEPMGNATLVSIAFQTAPSFMGKLMWIFFKPEKMIGSMHEKSLNNIRTLVEANTAMGERMGRSVAKMTATPNSKTKVEKA
ncbi:MAG: SRPBCC family protein, partial [Alphaproteobacteria bacterium]|nr:SRPBCC family protein [Alphaproteobacteria bacterium]